VVQKNFEKAMSWLYKALDQELPHAQCAYGYFHTHGEGGLPKDEQLGFVWFSKSAEQGYPTAYNNLGDLYKRGKGVDKDPQKAFQLFKLAAKCNVPHAQVNVGLAFLEGEGVEQNYDKAVKWFKKAALHSHGRACGELGDLYYAGEGVPQDIDEAIKWYLKAATLGNEDATSMLVEMYESWVHPHELEKLKGDITNCVAKINNSPALRNRWEFLLLDEEEKTRFRETLKKEEENRLKKCEKAKRRMIYRKNWPKIRLLYLGKMKEGSVLQILPMEIICYIIDILLGIEDFI